MSLPASGVDPPRSRMKFRDLFVGKEEKQRNCSVTQGREIGPLEVSNGRITKRSLFVTHILHKVTSKTTPQKAGASSEKQTNNPKSATWKTHVFGKHESETSPDLTVIS